jgi:hydroxymethylpyrimidine/phosphomethylpyrimidine kinase
MAKSPPIVLVFAASDPTGGAGMQADILTLAARGCHPISVVTALTVQDTRCVERVHAVDAALVAEQARCLLADFAVAAFKIGVLGSAQNVEAVARIVAAQPHAPVIIDQVLASGRGDALADCAQDMVARRVPIAIVKPLEVIEVDHQGAQLIQRTTAWADVRKKLLQVAPVGEAC